MPAMRVETPAGTAFRLTYGAETGGEPAVGFDRSALDPALLELRERGRRRRPAGRVGPAVDLARADRRVLTVRDGPDGGRSAARAVVVGADGPRSIVARAAGVVRPPALGRPDRAHVARRGRHRTPGRATRAWSCSPTGYCGIAPVPGGRVNIGIVLGRDVAERLRRRRDGGAAALAGADPAAPPRDPEAWRTGRSTDAIAGRRPLGTASRAAPAPAGSLVGDAAGFLDPFTGEGLHRALVSAQAGRGAIDALRGAARPATRASPPTTGPCAAGSRARTSSRGSSRRSSTGRALFEYAARQLAERDDVRATMGLVMGDLVPASRALDPRFLAGLLGP